jgi:hypothetical protein
MASVGTISLRRRGDIATASERHLNDVVTMLPRRGGGGGAWAT